MQEFRRESKICQKLVKERGGKQNKNKTQSLHLMVVLQLGIACFGAWSPLASPGKNELKCRSVVELRACGFGGCFSWHCLFQSLCFRFDWVALRRRSKSPQRHLGVISWFSSLSPSQMHCKELCNPSYGPPFKNYVVLGECAVHHSWLTLFWMKSILGAFKWGHRKHRKRSLSIFSLFLFLLSLIPLSYIWWHWFFQFTRFLIPPFLQRAQVSVHHCSL